MNTEILQPLPRMNIKALERSQLPVPDSTGETLTKVSTTNTRNSGNLQPLDVCNRFQIFLHGTDKCMMMLAQNEILEDVQECLSKQGIRLLQASVVDHSKGCDQIVLCVKCVDSTRIIIKYPKEEKDKVEKQYIMSVLAERGGLNSSRTICYTADYLIESYIPGNSLSLEKHADNGTIWYELGRQMKYLHSIESASGFSNRCIGESCTKFPIYDSYYNKMSENLKWENSGSIPGIDDYLASMLVKHNFLDVNAVFLHYDIAFDNIIVSTDTDSDTETPTVSLIDFADAGMGDWREDFAFLYCNLHGTPQWEYVLDGYGGVSSEDIHWMGFFCVVWLTWALAGEDQPEKRLHQLRIAETIVAGGI